MPIRYPRHVRQRGTLNVSVTQEFLVAPAWGLGMYQRGLFEFNKLSALYNLGVSMVPAGAENFPGGLGGDVIIGAHSGTGTYFLANGSKMLQPLPVGSDVYSGATLPINAGGGAVDLGIVRVRSYVFMTASPLFGGIVVNVGIRLKVLLHELIHACGLLGTEPNHGDNDLGIMPPAPRDLFATGGLIVEVTGHPEQSYVSWGSDRAPGPNGEFTLTSITQAMIRDNWRV